MLMMNMFDMSPEIVGEMFGEYIRTKHFVLNYVIMASFYSETMYFT